MKKSEFPEKAYEILVDSTLLSMGFDIYVPSQTKEAKLGYDALFQHGKFKVGFFQYKIVKEYHRIPYYHCFAPKAFKFDLHFTLRNKYLQHNILVRKNKGGLFACYLVPLFVRYKDLYDYYHNGSLVTSNSVALKPIHTINDTKYHYITFDNKPFALQHSKEAMNVECLNINELKHLIKQTNSITKEELTNNVLEDFYEIFKEIKTETKDEYFDGKIKTLQNIMIKNSNVKNLEEQKEELAIKLLSECGIFLGVIKDNNE